jgi:hypothetical protein
LPAHEEAKMSVDHDQISAREFVASVLAGPGQAELPGQVELTHGCRSVARATTLAECVPLLAVVLDVVEHGPHELTMEAIETYRADVMELLEHIRPIVEREANVVIADWPPALFAHASNPASA